MTRNTKNIKEKIIGFFKDRNILCCVCNLEKFIVRVSFLKDDKEHYFNIQNRFNGKKDNWASFYEKLEVEYQNSLFK
ncbi:MAG: hypothetical protein KAI33_08575 [Elusimicrobiales bacterium]|nr:hypothetical protein [Elusimicrobiales bacterium]